MNHKIYNQRRIAIAVFAFLLLIISCNENSITPTATNSAITVSGKGSANSRITSYTFDGSEGGAISLDTASKWINHYAINNNNIIITSGYFSKKALQSILGIGGCMGVRFYYSKAETGQSILLAIGADKNGNDFQSPFRSKGTYSSVSLFEKKSLEKFTGSESDSVTLETSKSRIGSYAEGNPNGIIAHFFGYQIIEQILLQKNCVGLRCYYALDNKQGEAKLILVGVDGNSANILPNSNIAGRKTSETDAVLADFSFPCPTYCSGN